MSDLNGRLLWWVPSERWRYRFSKAILAVASPSIVIAAIALAIAAGVWLGGGHSEGYVFAAGALAVLPISIAAVGSVVVGTLRVWERRR
jgi:hypothetical protein